LKRILKALLIEDNPDDAELLRVLSADINGVFLNITTSDTLTEGLQVLNKQKFDIILLDLFLPDSAGMETLSAILASKTELPVIVLSGHNDEAFASEAVHQGAQDYLIKGQLDSNLLWRSVNYAIERKMLQKQLDEMHMRDRQNKEIDSLKHISGSSPTRITAQFLGITSIKKVAPELYRAMVEQYGKVLDHSIEKRVYKVNYNITNELRLLSQQLGFLKAGPRDVIEIHTSVLEKKCHGAPHAKAQAYIEEGRIILLELMGDVVMFYRNYYVENGSTLSRPPKRESISQENER